MDLKKDRLDLMEDTVRLTGIHTGADNFYDYNHMDPKGSLTVNAAGIGINVLTQTSTGPAWTATDWSTINTVKPQGTLTLEGEDADIYVNGESLMQTLRGIQEQLNILRPHSEMEQEWQELREIREQYETKLAECQLKSKVWKALKS